MLQILIADDHELTRVGLRLVIQAEAGWRVCGEAPNGREAVVLAARTKPDVAILDVHMPEMGGLEAARDIQESSPLTAILLLTGHDARELPGMALSVGARGYVHKSNGAAALTMALRSIAAGSEARTAARSSTATPAVEEPPLTSRERQIAQLLAEGKSNRSVGTILGISVKTVETHRANIMKKLGLESVVELVHYAVRNQLVVP